MDDAKLLSYPEGVRSQAPAGPRRNTEDELRPIVIHALVRPRHVRTAGREVAPGSEGNVTG